MDKKKRYTATADGNLVDTRRNLRIEVASFAVIRSGRIPVVRITDRAGKKYTIARYAIDETAYSYGLESKKDSVVPAAPEAKEWKRKSAKTTALAPTIHREVNLAASRALGEDLDGALMLLKSQCHARIDGVFDNLQRILRG